MSDYLTPEFTSAQPQPQQTPSSSPSATQDAQSQIPPDDINSPFVVLDNSIISTPYNEDQSVVPEYERSVADALMRLMMNTRAWSEARPSFEAEREKEHLVAEIANIEARQREQGRSSFSMLESVRQRLVAFIASVKSALSDLQG